MLELQQLMSTHELAWLSWLASIPCSATYSSGFEANIQDKGAHIFIYIYFSNEYKYDYCLVTGVMHVQSSKHDVQSFNFTCMGMKLNT